MGDRVNVLRGGGDEKDEDGSEREGCVPGVNCDEKYADVGC